MAASGKAGWDDMFAPRVPGFVKVPFGDLNAVAAAINANTTAVMLEPIQGGTFNGNPLMTAAGLAVAIPAVLAYNWFGRIIGRIEAELEGFARDLRELLAKH